MLSNRKREALLDGKIGKGPATWWKLFITFGYLPAAVLYWAFASGASRLGLELTQNMKVAG
jgi:hypothetical protein